MEYPRNEILYCDERFIAATKLLDMQRYNDKQWRYDSLLLLFCISGRIVLTVQGKEYEVTKDQLFMCQNVRVLETAMTSTDFECIAWGLNLNYVNEVLGPKVDWMKFLLHLDKSPLMPLGDQLEYLVNSYQHIFEYKFRHTEHPFFRQSLNALIELLLYDLMAIYLRENTVDGNSPGVSSKSITKRFLLALGNDDCRHRTVSYFADKLNISARYLTAVCKQESGKTPSELIHERTIDRIRQLLHESDLSIKEIAHKLDFPNISFFGKYVRQRLGCSPSKYRAGKQ
ncbi:helix-turn-helix transcriptional regulator [Parabacteroides distasonis]|uniref:helix-turn-helix transcriptional regulator n=1 Tax=Parabacteroides distasonis TaxID=823 RepID=UPI00325B4C80